jgi:hypothetical protein
MAPKSDWRLTDFVTAYIWLTLHEEEPLQRASLRRQCFLFSTPPINVGIDNYFKNNDAFLQTCIPIPLRRREELSPYLILFFRQTFFQSHFVFANNMRAGSLRPASYHIILYTIKYNNQKSLMDVMRILEGI